MKALLLATIWLSLTSWAQAAGASDPVVAVTGGRIQGKTLPAPGGAAFKGIPFAAPPLGTLRWREPAPVVAWTGVRDAGSFGASCVQEISGWNNQEAAGNKEDCLYLNIWTAEWPSVTKKPVMVWLHGGGNTGGGASVDYFDGMSLSRKGVVVVTINYRLGVMGYFVHPGLTSESAHHASGNYGLLDQLAALKWVRDNIARFGGDPDNVTLFGQSAGAVDTSYHLASSLSKGLFHRVIQESGPPIRDFMTLADAERAGERFATSLGAPSGKGAVAFLRALPAEHVQKAAVAARGNEGPNIGPSIDGWFMPSLPARIYAAGKEHAVPVIVGNNAREQGAPAPEALRKAVTDAYGVNADKALAFYGLTTPGAGKEDPLYGPAGIQFTADTRYRCGAVAEALWHTAAGNTVYEYQFDHAIAGRPATQHSAEVPYVFGNLLPAGFLGGPYVEADHAISGHMQQYWTNFARTGDPNGAGLPRWPKFDATSRAFMEFTDNGPVVGAALRQPICDLYIENLRHELNL